MPFFSENTLFSGASNKTRSVQYLFVRDVEESCVFVEKKIISKALHLALMGEDCFVKKS